MMLQIWFDLEFDNSSSPPKESPGIEDGTIGFVGQSTKFHIKQFN